MSQPAMPSWSKPATAAAVEIANGSSNAPGHGDAEGGSASDLPAQSSSEIKEHGGSDDADATEDGAVGIIADLATSTPTTTAGDSPGTAHARSAPVCVLPMPEPPTAEEEEIVRRAMLERQQRQRRRVSSEATGELAKSTLPAQAPAEAAPAPAAVTATTVMAVSNIDVVRDGTLPTRQPPMETAVIATDRPSSETDSKSAQVDTVSHGKAPVRNADNHLEGGISRQQSLPQQQQQQHQRYMASQHSHFRGPPPPHSTASAPAFVRATPRSPTSTASLPPGGLIGAMGGGGSGRPRPPPSAPPGSSNFSQRQQQQQQQQQQQPPLPLTPTLPSSSAHLPTIEARDALIASMSNLLDHKLHTRASQLHSNSAALAKQERDVAQATEGLRRETAKLERVARDAGKKVKELGNVQNWAEVLERDLLVIEETIRLANRPPRPRDSHQRRRRSRSRGQEGGGGGGEGEQRDIGDRGDDLDSDQYASTDEGSERCSDCEGSCCWSGSGSGSDEGERSDDEREQPRDRRGHGSATLPPSSSLANHSNSKSSGGVKVEINDDLLASLSEAMKLDIYGKHDDSRTGEPTDSGISMASASDCTPPPSLPGHTQA